VWIARRTREGDGASGQKKFKPLPCLPNPLPSLPPSLQIVVLGGPDMGKTGKLIGMDEGNKGVIKLDTNGAFTEVNPVPPPSLPPSLSPSLPPTLLPSFPGRSP
jgi:hypothetical protein